MLQHFIIEGKWLGQSPRQKVWAHNEPQTPCSLLFFCEVCGTVYATCPVCEVQGHPSTWQSVRKCCSQCQPNTFTAPAGSIWLSWDEPFTLALPPAVLEREFLLHLNHFSKDHI